jgi:hypothetical protein
VWCWSVDVYGSAIQRARDSVASCAIYRAPQTFVLGRPSRRYFGRTGSLDGRATTHSHRWHDRRSADGNDIRHSSSVTARVQPTKSIGGASGRVQRFESDHYVSVGHVFGLECSCHHHGVCGSSHSIKRQYTNFDCPVADVSICGFIRCAIHFDTGIYFLQRSKTTLAWRNIGFHRNLRIFDSELSCSDTAFADIAESCYPMHSDGAKLAELIRASAKN